MNVLLANTKTLFDRLMVLGSSFSCLWKFLFIFRNINVFTRSHKCFSNDTIFFVLGNSLMFSSHRFFVCYAHCRSYKYSLELLILFVQLRDWFYPLFVIHNFFPMVLEYSSEISVTVVLWVECLIIKEQIYLCSILYIKECSITTYVGM